jgi:hypothetical protein
MSSSGEMKISLRLMTCFILSMSLSTASADARSYVLVLEMFQELQLSVCSLGKDRRAERFHDLFNRYRLAGELILR